MNSNTKRYQCTYLSRSFNLESHSNLGRHDFNRRHKRHYPDTGGRRGETEECDYDLYPSVSEERPSDAVDQDDDCPSPAVMAPCLNEQDDECAPDKIRSYVPEIVGLLLPAAKKGNPWIASLLVYFPTDMFFAMNILKW